MHHIDFLEERYRIKLQKKSARETRVGLRVLAYTRMRYFAYPEKRVRASVLAIYRQVFVKRTK